VRGAYAPYKLMGNLDFRVDNGCWCVRGAYAPYKLMGDLDFRVYNGCWCVRVAYAPYKLMVVLIMGNGLYLYGILPTNRVRPLALHGLDKQPIQTHPVDEFSFLYSETQQERYLASRRNLLGHEDVLEKVMEHGYRSVLPLQFGLIVKDWAHVKAQLIVPYQDRLKELFHKLEGKREVGVKIFWEETEELNLLMTENQGLREKRDSLEGKRLSMDEIIGIGQEIEWAMKNRQQGIIEKFQQLLNPLAEEIVENDNLTSAMIYNAAYLIPWDTEPQFGDKIEELDHYFNNRLRIRYNNFTAPFNFAQLSS
jgi:Gas vesicle synthesis protein GvpL/GvpF.